MYALDDVRPLVRPGRSAVAGDLLRHRRGRARRRSPARRARGRRRCCSCSARWTGRPAGELRFERRVAGRAGRPRADRAAAAADRLRLPAVQPRADADRARQRRGGAGPAGAAASASGASARAARLEDVGLGGRADHLPSQLSRRRAAARGDRPRAVHRAGRGARRRADRQPRPRRRRGRRRPARLASTRTVIVVTHDAELAARAPRVIRLRDGEVVAGRDAAPASPGLRAVELPVGDVDGGAGVLRGRARRRAGRRRAAARDGRGGVTVTLDALRAREPIVDPGATGDARMNRRRTAWRRRIGRELCG